MKYTPNTKHQSGVVLVISLIMLLLLTMIGVTSMQVTALEEKMAGNSKDKNTAFQAAEAALRDAEIDIRTSGRISGVTGMTNTCTNGLCFFAGATISNIWEDTAKVANATSYGTFTPAANIAGLSAQPEYLIVGAKFWPPGASSWKYIYTTTVIAQGGLNTTRTILQSVYAP